MRRFEYNFEGDEFRDREDTEFIYEMTSDDPFDAVAKFSPFAVSMQGALGFNHQMLTTAIQVCEKSWFWKFRSLKSKLELIVKSYTVLQKLTEIDLEDIDFEEIAEGEES